MAVILLQILFIYIYIQNIHLINFLDRDIISKSVIPSYKLIINNKLHQLSEGHFWGKRPLIVKSRPTNSIPVLVYHGVVKKDDGSNIPIDKFRDQMVFLKEHGYQTIKIEGLEDFLVNNKKLPDKSFLLTFDDGRKDSYYPVDTILKALDYSAVMFIISDHSLFENSSYYLSQKELKNMISSGRWSIQAHTKNGHNSELISEDKKQGNFYSNLLWIKNSNRLESREEYLNRIRNDLEGVKRDIVDMLGQHVTSIAYPFGDYGQEQKNNPSAERDIEEIVNKNYVMAFSQVRQNTAFTQNYFDITHKKGTVINVKRIEVKSEWSPQDLEDSLKHGASKTLPYLALHTWSDSWVKTRGNFYSNFDNLVLESVQNSTGSSVYLDGTNSWTDYIFTSVLSVKKGAVISLIARYKNDRNYASCNFSKTYTSLTQHLEGKNIKIIESKNILKNGKQIPINMNNLKVGILVNGNKVTCFMNDIVTVRPNRISNSLMNGGIGFQTWDEDFNNSEVVVENMYVDEYE